MSETQGRKPILSDHRREGKKLVPPFVSGIAPLGEVPWTKVIVPELVWIGLLLEAHGEERSTELSVSLMQAADNARRPDGPIWYGTTTSFGLIAGTLPESVRSTLEAEGTLSTLADALRPLLVLYPECPLSFLAPDLTEAEDERATLIEPIKRTLIDLDDRHSRFATMAQATFVHLGFTSGRLKVHKGLALANFPEIERYPETEESERVAASVRASVNGFIGFGQGDEPACWPPYFWNRGLELAPCESPGENRDA